MTEKKDKINPSHYQSEGGRQVIDFIETYNLGFCLGNAVKYLFRAGKKEGESPIEDLEKALWYIKRAEWEMDYFRWSRPLNSWHTEFVTYMKEFEVQEDLIPIIAVVVGVADFSLHTAYDELYKIVWKLKEKNEIQNREGRPQ